MSAKRKAKGPKYDARTIAAVLREVSLLKAEWLRYMALAIDSLDAGVANSYWDQVVAANQILARVRPLK